MTLVQSGTAVTGRAFFGNTNTLTGSVSGTSFTYTVVYSGTVGISDSCQAQIQGQVITSTCTAVYPRGNGSYSMTATRPGGGEDSDGDGVPDSLDQCPSTPAGAPVDANGCSRAQVDSDLDDLCNPGTSSSWCSGSDNCPTVSNADQADSDLNGVGDACEIACEAVAFGEIGAPSCPPSQVRLDLTLDPAFIEPSGLQSTSISNLITATVTLKNQHGQPMVGEPVTFHATPTTLADAGHAHSNVTGLVQRFVDDVPNPATSCKIDSNGNCHLNYVVPEISGVYRITAVFQAISVDKDLSVGVTGLMALGSGVGFVTTPPTGGQTTTHPDNHFGTIELAGAVIPSFAADYSLHKHQRLGINDMSLEFGGIFDLNNAWTNASGHSLHRYGTSVDVNRREVNGGVIDQKFLDSMALDHGLIRIPEPPAVRQKCLASPPNTDCIHYELYR